MPKPVIFAVAAASLLLVVACKSNSGGVTPTPVPSVSQSPGNVTHAVVQVTVVGTPTAKIPVAMSTPASKTNPRPGKTIVTLHTDKKGIAKFTKLKNDATYCWVATLGPSQQSSICADWTVWQFQTVQLGT